MNSFLPVLPNSRRKDVQKLLPGWRGDVVIDQRRICGGEAKLIWHRNLIEHMSYIIYICIHTCIYIYISICTCCHFCQSCMILDPQQTSNHGFGLQLSWESAWNGEWQSRTRFILFWNTCCTGFNTMRCYGHVWIVSIKQCDLYHVPIKE